MTSESIKSKVFMVECDGCGEMFDASHYEDITTRHPHYNLILDGILMRDRKFLKELKSKILSSENVENSPISDSNLSVQSDASQKVNDAVANGIPSEKDKIKSKIGESK